MREYLVDLNATQAAIRAGYSEKTAKQQGARLLTDVDVAASVKAAMDKRAAKVGLSAERVLEELQGIAFADPEDGEPVDEMDPGPMGGMLARRRAGGGLRYEHKLKALELLGKHLKLFTDKHEHAGKDGAPLTVQIIRKVTE